MTAGDLITLAREFLDGARKHKVTELPPSVLVREDAELRRQLGQVLDVLAEYSEVLGQALADALAWRTPEGWCPQCDASPAGLCDDHAADLDQTDAYLQLAAELGIEIAQ